MANKEIDKTLKRLVELFYQQYIKDLKSGKLNSTEKQSIKSSKERILGR